MGGGLGDSGNARKKTFFFDGCLPLDADSLLLAQVFYPFSKSMLNRKMVFRVTKSQSMTDKISFIWYHMIILRWGVWLEGGGLVGWGGGGAIYIVFSGGLSENEWKNLNERDHKIYSASESMGGRINFFSSTWGPGGIFWQERYSGVHLEHPEKVIFLTERGRKRVKEWR